MFKEVRNLLDTAKAEKTVRTGNYASNSRQNLPPHLTAANLSNKLIIVEKGTILDVVPYLRLYRVALLHGHVIACTYALDTSIQLLGVSSATTLPVGTSVLVIRVPGDDYGIIISAVPDFTKTYGDSPADEIVAGSNAGFFGDLHQKAIMYYQPPGGGGIYSWKDGIVDVLPGDWVKFSRLGSALFLTDFLSGFRLNEYCGIWMNYLDSLMRIAGLNYQLWTGGSEEYSLLFWRAFLRYRGYGYTVDSQLGKKEPDASLNPFLYPDASYYEHPDARLSNVEPITIVSGETSYVSRLPQHQVQEWEGVLGQGGMKWVFGRAPNAYGFPVPTAQIGTTAQGTYIVQTKNGILLAKYPYITAPLRVSDPDENYGKPTPEQFEQNLQRYISALRYFSFTGRMPVINDMHPLDIRNLLCNWEAQAGFYLLSRKFKFINEKEIFNATRQSLFSSGAGLGCPAFLYIDPLGDILIQNGHGVTIELRGSSVRISGPGDMTIDCANNLTLFGSNVTIAAEKRVNIIAKDRIHMQVAKGENVPQLDSETYSDANMINGFKNKDQVFVLSSTGEHAISGCLSAEYLSTALSHVGACTDTVVGAGYYAMPLPISHQPAPWVYHVVASGSMRYYKPSTVLQAYPTNASVPKSVESDGKAKIPTDVSASADFSTLSMFPMDGGRSLGVSNMMLVSRYA